MSRLRLLVFPFLLVAAFFFCIYPNGQYQNQVTLYQPAPVVTNAVMTHAPSAGNHFTTAAGYAYPYYHQNDGNTTVSQYPSSNLWDQATAAINQPPGLLYILTSFQQLSLRALPTYTTTPPNLLGQSSLYANIGNAPAPNPFRLQRVATPAPALTPPPRLRRQLHNTTSNKVIKKKVVPKKTFMQAFLEANQPNHQSSLPTSSNYNPLIQIDVYVAPAPEPFETPGECRIEMIKNQDFVPTVDKEEQKKSDEDDSDKIIDVEK
uniref:Uncharacterized protein n=1 Tax=Panagrolaimus sp. ES5 TaxID=591445 RepID=A0AC34GR52_9BILA